MHKVTIDQEVIAIPSDWNELNRAQLLEVSGLVRRPMLKTEAKLRLTLLLLGYRWFNFKRNRLISRLTSVQIHAITELIAWVMKPPMLTRQLLPYINRGLCRYYGPSHRLDNVRFGEWAFADSYYLQFNRTKSREALDKLIAVLYRPRKWYWPVRWFFPFDSADPRVPFNQFTIDKRAKRIASLSLQEKMAVLIFFEGCRADIIRRHPNVFSESHQESGQNFGWAGLLVDLSGQRFGDFSSTFQTPFSAILLHLERESIKAQKQPQT